MLFYLPWLTPFHIVVRSFGVPSIEELLIGSSVIAGEMGGGEPEYFLVLHSIVIILSITLELGSSKEKAQAIAMHQTMQALEHSGHLRNDT